MGRLNFDDANSIYYEWNPPIKKDGISFVFFNALTGDHNAWEAAIAPALRQQGHGSLVFNFRGQAQSTFSIQTVLDDKLIASDAIALLAEIKPPRPVLVGWSIGGLFAAQAILGGAEAIGLVMINTLRRIGPRLAWFNEALVRVTEVGGLDLLRDLYLPLLMNQDWLKANRANFLKDQPYNDLDPASGSYKLLSEAGIDSDWNIAYDKLDLPVLVITGLQDHVFYEELDVAELFAKLPNGMRVNLPQAGHMIPAEHPMELVKLLAGMVGEI